MKVCMIAYTFYEGDNRVRRYAETLVKRGDSVDIIALRQTGAYAYAKVSGVNVYKIQKRIINEKLKVDYLIKLLLFLIRSMWTLAKLNFKKRYDVVHVHSIPDFEVFAALPAKLTGAKVFLDIHDIVPELFASKFNSGKDSFLFKALVFVERASMWFSDHVIVANHIWYERLIRRSVSPQKCSVVMNYPDPDIFVQKKYIKDPDKFIMVYPGTLSKHQGLETAIRAVQILKDDIPKLEFHIYGKGTDEDYFVKLVKDLNLEDRVLFKGIVPIEKVPEIMGNASIGVEPKLKRSFGNEAFSTKILEFMLLGVPVVASDTLVHTHYFDESLLKFFISENEHDLAKHIKYMEKNKQGRNILIRNALTYMKDNNWEARKNNYLNLIDSVVYRKYYPAIS